MKAYDYTKHKHILSTLINKGCPKPVVAAWIRELRGTKVKLKLADLETRAIHRTRSLLQGDPAAPTLFNYTLDEPLTNFQNLCQRNKWGIRLQDDLQDPFYLGIICFADNYWILAMSPTE